MKQDLVSIIIPIYNVSAYLDKCVASACNQTYPYLQIILVDDGSPDNCPEMCDAWAEKDSRIQVIHKKNGGLSDARNAGLDVATGKYIYFLDADDYIESTLVETALRHMADGVDMVVFPYLAHNSDGTVHKCSYQVGKYLLPDGKKRAEFAVDTLLQYHIGWEAWSRVYIRENIERHNLRFANNREIFAEDLYFCLCYCAHAEQVVCISDALYHYILRDDSIMGNNVQKLNVGRMNQLAKHLFAYYKETGDCRELLDVFPTIHYYIIINVLERARRNGLLSHRKDRKKLLADIEDWPFFRKNVLSVLMDYHLLEKHDVGNALADKLNYLWYVIDGFYPGLALRSRCINRFAERIKKVMGKNALQKRKARILAKQHYDIYVIGTEDFGNLGDHQIARSIMSFLKEKCPDKTIVEVTATMYPDFKDALRLSIRKDAIIVMPGGGNFGDVYPLAQNIRQDVIETWKENRKIVFPQTIHFTQTKQGQTFLKQAQQIYTRDNNVILIAREKTSFSFAKEFFECPCLLMPDIVLWEKQYIAGVQRGSVLLVLRSDQEKAYDLDPEALAGLQGRYFQRLDHQLSHNVDVELREQTVQWVFEQYLKASLVITDRLHGMVFAAVTGTPCIAFGNYNHKVSGTYEWIKHLPYVRYAESVDQAEEWIPELLEMGGKVYENTPITHYFERLAQVVKQYANH